MITQGGGADEKKKKNMGLSSINMGTSRFVFNSTFLISLSFKKL